MTSRVPGRAAAVLAAVSVAVAPVVTACSEPAGRQVDSASVAIADVATTPPMGWNSWNTFGCNAEVLPRSMTVDPAVVNAHGDVREVWTGKLIAQDAAPFTITVAPGDTAVYRIG